MKLKNYFQLCKELVHQKFDEKVIGYYIAEAIISNMEQNISIYPSGYKKDFANKENKKIFNTLEGIINNEDELKREINEKDIMDLNERYKIVVEKTTEEVFEVNFMYDIFNFYISQAEINYEEAFKRLHNQVISLRTADWKPKNLAPYKLNKADILTREYNALINRARNKVQKNFGVIFQNN